MNKYALVVGVNDYSRQNSTDLSWCVSDADSMYFLLKNAFGFQADNIVLLKDASATRRNILSTLTKQLSFAEPGDVVCFFFAGHGGISPATLAPDNSRFYEGIVPYLGEVIYDLDLDDLLSASNIDLSQVNFTMILDSCFSGGLHIADAAEQVGSRTYAFDTITEIALADIQTWWPFGICLPEGSEEIFMNVSDHVWENHRLVSLGEDPDTVLPNSARALVVSACKFHETAGESEQYGHGFLTQAFLDIVAEDNFTISYQELASLLEHRVHQYSTNRQTPQLRGLPGRLDHPFLEGWNASL